MIESFVILSSRGDPLVIRDFKNRFHVRSITETFFQIVRRRERCSERRRLPLTISPGSNAAASSEGARGGDGAEFDARAEEEREAEEGVVHAGAYVVLERSQWGPGSGRDDPNADLDATSPASATVERSSTVAGRELKRTEGKKTDDDGSGDDSEDGDRREDGNEDFGESEFSFKKNLASKSNQACGEENKVVVVYTKKENLYLSLVPGTQKAPLAYWLEILELVARLIKDFCGQINEELVRRNFALVYELIDEVFDFGYVQSIRTGQLTSVVQNEVEPDRPLSPSSTFPSLKLFSQSALELGVSAFVNTVSQIASQGLKTGGDAFGNSSGHSFSTSFSNSFGNTFGNSFNGTLRDGGRSGSGMGLGSALGLGAGSGGGGGRGGDVIGSGGTGGGAGEAGGGPRTVPSNASRTPISVASDGSDVFIDIIDKLYVEIDASGQILHAELTGQLVIKSYLLEHSTMPSLRLAFDSNLLVRNPRLSEEYAHLVAALAAERKRNLQIEAQTERKRERRIREKKNASAGAARGKEKVKGEEKEKEKGRKGREGREGKDSGENDAAREAVGRSASSREERSRKERNGKHRSGSPKKRRNLISALSGGPPKQKLKNLKRYAKPVQSSGSDSDSASSSISDTEVDLAGAASPSLLGGDGEVDGDLLSDNDGNEGRADEELGSERSSASTGDWKEDGLRSDSEAEAEPESESESGSGSGSGFLSESESDPDFDSGSNSDPNIGSETETDCETSEGESYDDVETVMEDRLNRALLARKGPFIDDCVFHENANLSDFTSEMAVNFVPTQGEFVLMKYRKGNVGLEIPIVASTNLHVNPNFNSSTNNQMELTLDFSQNPNLKLKNARSFGVFLLNIPMPTFVTACQPSVSLIKHRADTYAGKNYGGKSYASSSSSSSSNAGLAIAAEGAGVAEFVDHRVRWTHRRLELSPHFSTRLTCKLSLDLTLMPQILLQALQLAGAQIPQMPFVASESLTSPERLIAQFFPPAQISFELPMHSSSHLQIRYLRVTDSSGFSTPRRWVRYVTQSHNFVVKF